MPHAFDLAWVNRLVADYLLTTCIDHSKLEGPPPMNCLSCWALGKIQDDLANGRICLAQPPKEADRAP